MEEKGKIGEPKTKKMKLAEQSKSFCVLPLKPSHEIIWRNHDVDKIYGEMHRLKTSQPSNLTAVVLSGCSGCGKTELARQIGEKFFSEKASEYDFVFTVDACSLNSILQSHIDLANILPCDKPSIRKICDLDKELQIGVADKVPLLQALIGNRINENSSWLLIVDGAKTDAECIFNDTSQWLQIGDESKYGKGQVLITTESITTEFLECQDSHMIELPLSDGISPSESVQILTQLSGLPNNEDIVARVAKALDFQPLALVCSALGLKELDKSSQTNVTNLWKMCLEDIEMAKQEDETDDETVKYPKTTINAVNKAVRKLSEKDEITKCTLQLLSFMAPQPIPFQYVVNYVKNMVGGEEAEIKNAIFSCPLVLGRLLEVIAVHHLVYSCLQEASDLRDTDALRNIFPDSKPIKIFNPLNHLEVLCKLTMRSFPNLADFDDTKDLDSTRPLVVHIDYIVTQLHILIDDYPVLMDLPLDDEHNVLTVLTLISKFCNSHEMARARMKMLNICSSFEDHYSDEDDVSKELLLMKKMGDIHTNLDLKYKARQCFERVLEIEEDEFGEEDQELSPTLSKLANLYFQEEQPDEAQEMFERLIKIQETALDEKDPVIADTFCQLGELHKCVAEHNEAISYFERALEIYRMAYHENHPKIAETLGSLSFNLFHLDKYEEAKNCAEQKVKILENSPESEPLKVAKALDNLGNITRVLGKYAEAQKYFKRSLEIKSKMPENDQKQYAESLANLGNITADLGNYEEGRKYLEEALKIQQEIADGEGDASVAMTMGCLASVYLMCDNYADAKDCFERTLNIQENIYPENHVEKAKTLGMLGDTLYEMNHMEEAKRTLERGINMAEKLNGSGSTLASLLGNLSKVFIKLGKYLDAKHCLEKSLVVEESIYDDKHPTLAITWVNLAIVCNKLGKLQEAKLHCEKALEIQESAYGETHPKIVDTLNTLGSILRCLGHYKEAQKCFERALAIHNTMPVTKDSPSRTLNNLGLVLIDLGLYKQAKKYIEDALEMVKSKHGEKHPETAKVLGNLGTVLCHLEEYSEALKVYETVLQIEEGCHDEIHPNLALTLNNMSSVQRNLGDLEKSRKYAERAMEIVQKTFQEDHPLLASLNETLGLLYSDLGQHSKAKDCLQKALTTRKSKFGEEHPLIAVNLGNLAYVHVSCKEYKEAKPLLERSLEIEEKNFGENHSSSADTLGALANVLRNLGQFEEARKYAERAVKVRKEVYGDKHPSLVDVLTNLGLTLKNLNKHDQAQKVLDEADSIKKTENI